MVFYRGDEKFEKLAIARYDVGRLLKGSWDLNVFPDQWEALLELIEKRDPQQIGINLSENFGLADGLVHTEYEGLISRLPEKYQFRLRSAEDLAIAWLETRTEKEMEIYDGAKLSDML